MNHSRIERIRQLFLKLKIAYEWCNRNERNKNRQIELFGRTKPIFDELEQLGVPRNFSETLFSLGADFNKELVGQFQRGGGNSN